jgi:hypothetical protein
MSSRVTTKPVKPNVPSITPSSSMQSTLQKLIESQGPKIASMVSKTDQAQITDAFARINTVPPTEPTTIARVAPVANAIGTKTSAQSLFQPPANKLGLATSDAIQFGKNGSGRGGSDPRGGGSKR